MPGVDYFFKKCSGRVEFSESIVVLKVETRLDEELKIRVGLRIHVTDCVLMINVFYLEQESTELLRLFIYNHFL